MSKARKDKAAAEAAEADAHAKKLGIGKYAAAGGGGDGLDALRGALAVRRDEPERRLRRSRPVALPANA